MNIEIIDGCMSYAIYINGKDINDLTEDEKNDLIEHLLKKLKEGIRDNTVSIQSLIEAFQYDGYEYDKHACEQCGDTVSRTIWNI